MPSNVENILNAILTGDGSGIQKPASRVEELLFEIYKQGGGGESVIGGIKLTIDSDYIMTATLVDKDGEEYGIGDDIDLPLETMVVDGEYDSQTQKIKLELKNGNFVEFSVADLVSGLQTELSSNNKLNPAYIAYDEYHRAVSDTEKQTWNNKQNAISDLETIRSGAAAGATAVQPATMSEALALKQDSLSETQLAAVNSGINSTKVTQISTNQTNILYAIDTGVKNFLPLTSENETTGNVTFTHNDDGSVLVNSGSGSHNNLFHTLYVGKLYLKAGTYVLTGCPVGGSGSTYEMRCYNPLTESFVENKGTAVEFTLSSDSYVSEIVIRIDSTYTPSNLRFYPMICAKQIWDTTNHDFQKGALPNYDLTYLQAEDRAALAEEIDAGAKNKLQNKATSKTQNNVTYTVNADGEVTVSITGAASANTTLSLTNAYIPNTFKGNILSGVPAGTTSDTIYMYVAYSSNGSSEAKSIYVNAVSNPIHEILDYPYIQIFVFIYSGVTVSTALKFQPMICTKAAFGVSNKFVPYRPNYDLVAEDVERHISIDNGSTNRASITCDVSNWKDGIYMIVVNRSQSATTRYGTSMYFYTKRSDYTLPLFTKVFEEENTKITDLSCTNTGLLTLTYGVAAYYTVKAMRV